jgi:hypothetical protein
MRLYPRSPESHVVEVRDVRPTPASRTQFDPYYLALCACRWFGNPRPSAEEALREARRHAPDASGDVLRPVG